MTPSTDTGDREEKMRGEIRALFDSLVRTIVPMLVGAVMAFFVARGWDMDPTFEESLRALLVTVFSAGYYVAARLLEVYVRPWFGWLLGLPIQPKYAARH